MNDFAIEEIDETEEAEEGSDQDNLDSTPSVSSDEAIEGQFAKQPFRVVYQTNNFLLPQVRDLIIDGADVNMRPEYQRRLRWTNKQKSLLIESLLLNVPVPPVFFYENDLAHYEVMDGQQRLNAIKEFLSNDFSLRGLQILSSLNGRRYARLPPRVKRSLDRASISAIVLLQESQGRLKKAGSPGYYELRRFVFERLNTGGKRLSAQEIRNAIYGSAFNDLIVRLSRNEIFTRIWGIPAFKATDPNDYYEERARQKNSLYRAMGDCQLVLRFFALDDDGHIQGSMKSMLDKCMERNLATTSNEISILENRYLSRLELADEMFDHRPFTLRKNPGRLDRPVAGIYDGVMIAIDSLWESRKSLLANKTAILESYGLLLEREAEQGTLTGSANTSIDIKRRIRLFYDLFAEFA